MGVARLFFRSKQGVRMYLAQPDKTQNSYQSRCAKPKHIHSRTLALFTLHSCKMLLMLSKYKSLGPSQKDGSSYVHFIFNFTSKIAIY